MTMKTTTAAIRAVTIPTTKVAATAIEKAVWIPLTMAGMSGSTNAFASSGTWARIDAPRSPRLVSWLNWVAPPLRERVRELRRHPGRDELLRHLLQQLAAEDRARDREADRPAELLEQRQAARAGPEVAHWHGVLHRQREDREGRPDAEAGDEHPQPQERKRRIGPEVRHQEEAEREQEHRSDDQCLVPTGPRHELSGADGGDDQTADKREDLVAGLGCRAAVHELEPARQEDDRGEEAHRGQEHRGHAGREGPEPEELQRDDRLVRPRFGEHEECRDHDADRDQPADLRIGPFAELLVREADEERHERADQAGRRRDSRYAGPRPPRGASAACAR